MHPVTVLSFLLMATLASSQFQSHYVSGLAYPRPTTRAPTVVAAAAASANSSDATNSTAEATDPLDNPNRFGADEQQTTPQSTTEIYNNWPNQKLPFHILNRDKIQQHIGLGTRR